MAYTKPENSITRKVTDVLQSGKAAGNCTAEGIAKYIPNVSAKQVDSVLYRLSTSGKGSLPKGTELLKTGHGLKSMWYLKPVRKNNPPINQKEEPLEAPVAPVSSIAMNSVQLLIEENEALKAALREAHNALGKVLGGLT